MKESVANYVKNFDGITLEQVESFFKTASQKESLVGKKIVSIQLRISVPDDTVVEGEVIEEGYMKVKPVFTAELDVSKPLATGCFEAMEKAENFILVNTLEGMNGSFRMIVTFKDDSDKADYYTTSPKGFIETLAGLDVISKAREIMNELRNIEVN